MGRRRQTYANHSLSLLDDLVWYSRISWKHTVGVCFTVVFLCILWYSSLSLLTSSLSIHTRRYPVAVRALEILEDRASPRHKPRSPKVFKRLYIPATVTPTLHVTIAADLEYRKGLIACIHSIQYSTVYPVFFHVIVAQDESYLFIPAILRILEERNALELVEFDETTVRPLIKVWEGRDEHRSGINYARYYLPELFPDLVKTIFLDPDIIVKADITHLWRTISDADDPHYPLDDPPQGTDILAAMETPSTYEFLVECSDPAIQSVAQVTDCHRRYFNAGVLVIHLRRWVRAAITEELEYWLKENTKRRLWRYGSQPALALAFYRRSWTHLDVLWNVRNLGWHETLPDDLLEEAYILHWAGHRKPWSPNPIPRYLYYFCSMYPFKAPSTLPHTSEDRELFNAIDWVVVPCMHDAERALWQPHSAGDQRWLAKIFS